MDKWVKRVLSVLLACMLVVTVGPLTAPVNAAFSTMPMIAAGGSHSAVLKPDGTMWAWGTGADGTSTGRYPGQVSGLTDITAIATDYHSVALKSDGTVWTWGNYNEYGQLGNGTTTARSTPGQVSGLNDVTAISTGRFRTVAVKSNGTVWAWGDNRDGELGDGTSTQRSSPVQVLDLNGVAEVSGGNWHTVALKSNGTVWVWGSNGYGQLGDGTTTQRTTPVQAKGLADIKAISAGSSYTLALKSDGTVWAWGQNTNGQLGNGTTTNNSTPEQIIGLVGVKAIAAGSQHAVALKSDGTVWTWGNNYLGELGDGTGEDRHIPAQVLGLTGITAIAADGHTVALKSDGTLWAWGFNNNAQIGDGTTTQRNTPIQVTGENGVGYLNIYSNNVTTLDGEYSENKITNFRMQISTNSFCPLITTIGFNIYRWNGSNFDSLYDSYWTDRAEGFEASTWSWPLTTILGNGFYIVKAFIIDENGLKTEAANQWGWFLIEGYEYTITYNANGGSVSPTNAVAIAGKSMITPTPTKSYTLTYNVNGGIAVSPASKSVSCAANGWFTATSGGSKRADAGGSYTPTQTETIYAQWTNPTMGTLPTPTHPMSGNTFKGWFTATSGGTQVSSSTVMTGNQTIHAIWENDTIILDNVLDPKEGTIVYAEGTGLEGLHLVSNRTS